MTVLRLLFEIKRSRYFNQGRPFEKAACLLFMVVAIELEETA